MAKKNVFTAQAITGSVIILCSYYLACVAALGIPGIKGAPVAALILLIGIVLLRGNIILYILLFLVANIPTFFLWEEVHYDLCVYTGGDHGQTTMWILIICGTPLLLEIIAGIIGIILSIKGTTSASPNEHIPDVQKHHRLLPVKVSTEITSLLDAILNNNPNSVRAALAEHPEHLNTAYAQNGNTPLHVAALNGYTEIVRFLLEQPGIDTTLVNQEGKTACDLAKEKGFTEIAALLQNK